jgi:hypothetical protein
MADTLIREGVAYGSQPLSPVPQYWDGTSYAKVQGVYGAIRAILFNSAGETFTGASPGSVTVVSSAGGTAVLNSGNPGIVEVVLSAGGTPVFSNSNPCYATLIASAGGSVVFQKTNPAFVRSSLEVNIPAVYSGTATWTSGTTATASHTLTVSILTATYTTPNHEIIATNDSPYAVALNVYKTISANGSTFNTSSISTLAIPSETISSGVTINATRAISAGLFNFNQGLILRLTVTAAITATVTNNIIIKEAY